MSSFAPLASTISRLAMRDEETPAADGNYGYTPHKEVAILFLVLFGISTILHVGQATYYRIWWLLPTAALCGIGELLGWGGRLWSAITPTADTPFMIQISTIIIAPTPLLAAIFVIFSRVATQLGTSYGWLTPKWYTILFLPCDVIALVVQGVGGGIASSANDLAGANVGANVMLGGIAFQFVVIILFSALACDFVQRYVRERPVRAESSARGVLTLRLKLMLVALAFATTTLFVRSVYRIIELSGGWNGRIIHTEVYFNVLDGGMVVLAIFSFNLAHPGMLLRSPPQVKDIALESADSSRLLVAGSINVR